jgi:hypothetical protein
MATMYWGRKENPHFPASQRHLHLWRGVLCCDPHGLVRLPALHLRQHSVAAFLHADPPIYIRSSVAGGVSASRKDKYRSHDWHELSLPKYDPEPSDTRAASPGWHILRHGLERKYGPLRSVRKHKGERWRLPSDCDRRQWLLQKCYTIRANYDVPRSMPQN